MDVVIGGARKVTVGPALIKALRFANREAINFAAHAVTIEARKAVQAAIGPEQRLSGGITRKRPGKETRRVTPETIGKGGTRINPYYRNADSLTNPVALIGVRGPAHWIEHPRRGGYLIRPMRTKARKFTPEALQTMRALGLDEEDIARQAGKSLHAPALPMGGDVYRGSAKGGAITDPLAPITKTFDRAGPIVEAAVAEQLRKYLDGV